MYKFANEFVMENNVHYDAIITEWDGTESYVVAKREDDDVVITYKEGSVSKVLQHRVSYEHFSREMKPQRIGKCTHADTVVYN